MGPCKKRFMVRNQPSGISSGRCTVSAENLSDNTDVLYAGSERALTGARGGLVCLEEP